MCLRILKGIVHAKKKKRGGVFFGLFVCFHETEKTQTCRLFSIHVLMGGVTKLNDKMLHK